MTQINKILFQLILLCSGLSGFAQSYSQYVNPFIGTAATGHTFPGATVPFGMVQLSPETGNFGWNYCSGYRFEDSTITGFSHTHLNGTGGVDLGDILFFPFQGETPATFTSRFSKSSEKASPGYYTVVLSKDSIKAELTASAHTGVHRYTFNSPGTARLLVDLQSGLVDEAPQLASHVIAGSIRIVDDHTISGYRHTSEWVEKKIFFIARFNKTFKTYRFIDGPNKRRLILDFESKSSVQLEARVSISAVSVDGAMKNSSETVSKTFEETRAMAVKVWNQYLARIKAEGTYNQKVSFYTSVYHTLIQPNNIADLDGKYRGADGLVHQSAAKVFYSTFSLWDTFRAAHPLYTLICPQQDGNMVQSMLEHFKITKTLPIWTLWGKESFAMIGNHAIPVMVDASLKGIKGFDQHQVFKAIKTTLMNNGNPKYNWKLYTKYGYLPSDSVPREAVSRTLEAAYDDWCAAMLAKALHQQDDYAYFLKRSKFYSNLFDQSTNLMRGRLANGDWVTPFSNLDSAQLSIGGDYTEGNAWQYVWHVQQDIPALIHLMGGKEVFSNKLDSLFAMHSKVFGKASTLDVTGLIGQYAHGNEPDHHVPYLYTLAGNPAGTQRVIREITDQFYQNKPDGLAGNDDCGQMSAWYVFSTMGFYPVNPADGKYIFGAPQLPKISITVPGNKHFIILAKNLSVQNKYVQQILLNGKVYKKNYIRHQDIIRGGSLTFIMTNSPATANFKE